MASALAPQGVGIAAAASLFIEDHLRRLTGYRDLPVLQAALRPKEAVPTQGIS